MFSIDDLQKIADEMTSSANNGSILTIASKKIRTDNKTIEAYIQCAAALKTVIANMLRQGSEYSFLEAEGLKMREKMIIIDNLFSNDKDEE